MEGSRCPGGPDPGQQQTGRQEMLSRRFINLVAPPVKQNLATSNNIKTIMIKAPEDANVLRCSEMKFKSTL